MAMASVVCRLSRRFVLKHTGILTRNTGVKYTETKGLILFRNAVSTSSGAILPKPVKQELCRPAGRARYLCARGRRRR
ncbi:hypothetical protein SKAU_G00121470 [Synaphobranchus kaupii]|uniref:Uncharacterized protein n=1 Tax=Synaphobranchus kaupii TaxID=118154 RepID=A0A9Q1FP53_SYNKA|nr:hypothetical protein SKAU_G00121470 [Synaphobranchus kaupii]